MTEPKKTRKAADYLDELNTKATEEGKDRVCVDLTASKEIVRILYAANAFIYSASTELNMGVYSPEKVRRCKG